MGILEVEKSIQEYQLEVLARAKAIVMHYRGDYSPGTIDSILDEIDALAKELRK